MAIDSPQNSQCGAPVAFAKPEAGKDLAPMSSCPQAVPVDFGYTTKPRPGVEDSHGRIDGFNNSRAMLSRLGGHTALRLNLDSVENTVANASWHEDITNNATLNREYSEIANNSTADEGPTSQPSVNISDGYNNINKASAVNRTADADKVHAYAYKAEGTDVPTVDVASNVKHAGTKILSQVAPLTNAELHENGSTQTKDVVSYAHNIYGKNVTRTPKTSNTLEYLKNLAMSVSTAFVGSKTADLTDKKGQKHQDNANKKFGGYTHDSIKGRQHNRAANKMYKNGGNVAFAAKNATGARADWQAHAQKSGTRTAQKVWWDVFDEEASAGGKKMTAADPVVQSKQAKEMLRQKLILEEHDNSGSRMSYSSSRKTPSGKTILTKDATHKINELGRPGVGGAPGSGVVIPQRIAARSRNETINNETGAGQFVAYNALHSRQPQQSVPLDLGKSTIITRNADVSQKQLRYLPTSMSRAIPTDAAAPQ